MHKWTGQLSIYTYFKEYFPKISLWGEKTGQKKFWSINLELSINAWGLKISLKSEYINYKIKFDRFTSD